jgi:hypothetical protein
VILNGPDTVPALLDLNSRGVETASEAVDPYRDGPAGAFSELELTPSGEAAVAEPSVTLPRARPRPRPRTARRRRRPRLRILRVSASARQELAWICTIYLAARALLILVAVLNDAFAHHSLQSQLAHWDGLWYRELANNGYPRHVSYSQTTLGFFPLFSLTIWLVTPVVELFTTHNQIWSSTLAGLIISAVGGLIATIMIHRLADGWWGRDAARRATVLFVVFPGSVVFSMVYSEGLLLPLAITCVWALQRKRWLLAGTCAAFGTAVQPVGLVLAPVCGVAALIELWRHGWRAPSFRKAVGATAMSGIGVLSFMAFLWYWTGNPMATFIAQHHGWSEKTDYLALVHYVTRVAPAFDPNHFNSPQTINLNWVFGVVGAVIMAAELYLLWKSRREVPLPAITWTLAITFLAFTSEYVPPLPRMMITAFPQLMLVGRWVQGKWFAVIVFVNCIALAGLSLLTFYGHALRP